MTDRLLNLTRAKAIVDNPAIGLDDDCLRKAVAHLVKTDDPSVITDVPFVLTNSAGQNLTLGTANLGVVRTARGPIIVHIPNGK